MCPSLSTLIGLELVHIYVKNNVAFNVTIITSAFIIAFNRSIIAFNHTKHWILMLNILTFKLNKIKLTFLSFPKTRHYNDKILFENSSVTKTLCIGCFVYPKIKKKSFIHKLKIILFMFLS